MLLLSYNHLITSYHYNTSGIVPATENFQGSNFCKFCRFVAVCRSFLLKILERGTVGVAKASNLWKFSLRKSYFSPICESFLPRNFSIIQYLTMDKSLRHLLKVHGKCFRQCLWFQTRLEICRKKLSSIFASFVSYKQQLWLVYFRYANEIMLPWWWNYLCIQSLPNCRLWSRGTWKQAASKRQQRFCNPHFSAFLCLLLHLQSFVSGHSLLDGIDQIKTYNHKKKEFRPQTVCWGM